MAKRTRLSSLPQCLLSQPPLELSSSTRGLDRCQKKQGGRSMPSSLRESCGHRHTLRANGVRIAQGSKLLRFFLGSFFFRGLFLGGFVFRSRFRRGRFGRRGFGRRDRFGRGRHNRFSGLHSRRHAGRAGHRRGRRTVRCLRGGSLRFAACNKQSSGQQCRSGQKSLHVQTLSVDSILGEYSRPSPQEAGLFLLNS